MENVRLGLIGVGNVARLHAMGYDRPPNAELRAVCDIDPQRASEWGAANSYTNYHDLMADATSMRWRSPGAGTLSG